MFLHPKVVATPNRYVQNGPEDRAPAFRANVGPTVNGAILRYSTTGPRNGPAPVPVNRLKALAAIRAMAKAGS